MMRSESSKDSSRSFQVSSEISFLISVRKILPTSSQTIDVTLKKILVWELNGYSDQTRLATRPRFQRARTPIPECFLMSDASLSRSLSGPSQGPSPSPFHLHS